MPAKPDYYGVLGVHKAAAAPEIKAAFLKLAGAFHAAGKPKNIDDVEELRSYVTAYRVLSDPKKREFYDRTGFRLPETEPAGGMEAVPDQDGFQYAGDVLTMLRAAGIVIDVLS